MFTISHNYEEKVTIMRYKITIDISDFSPHNYDLVCQHFYEIKSHNYDKTVMGYKNKIVTFDFYLIIMTWYVNFHEV